MWPVGDRTRRGSKGGENADTDRSRTSPRPSKRFKGIKLAAMLSKVPIRLKFMLNTNIETRKTKIAIRERGASSQPVTDFSTPTVLFAGEVRGSFGSNASAPRARQE